MAFPLARPGWSGLVSTIRWLARSNRATTDRVMESDAAKIPEPSRRVSKRYTAKGLELSARSATNRLNGQSWEEPLQLGNVRSFCSAYTRTRTWSWVYSAPRSKLFRNGPRRARYESCEIPPAERVRLNSRVSSASRLALNCSASSARKNPFTVSDNPEANRRSEEHTSELQSR